MAPASRQTGPSRRAPKSAAAFRTISEVAAGLDVPQHVLRFWEGKFPQVRPLKRGGGRRYYRPEDVALLRRIRELLHHDGYTIRGVQKLLKEGAVKAAPGPVGDKPPGSAGSEALPAGAGGEHKAGRGLDARQRGELKGLLAELGELRDLLRREID